MLEEVLCAFALNVWSCLQMKVLMLERRELNLFSDFFFFLMQRLNLTAFCFPACK